MGFTGPDAGVVSESAGAFFLQTNPVYAGCGVATDQSTAPPNLPSGDCTTSRLDSEFALNDDFTFSATLTWVWAAFEKDGRLIDEVQYQYDYSSVTTPQPAAKPRLVEGLFAISTPRYLDAGPSMHLTGPGLDEVLAKAYVAPLTIYGLNRQQVFSGVVPPAVLQPGRYTVSAPGSADIAAFSVDFDGLAPVQLTNAADLARPIPLDQPLRLSWEGGSSAVSKINVTAAVTRSNPQDTLGSVSTSTSFSCSVDFAPMSYNVPLSVLQRMVPSDIIPGTLNIGTVAVKEVAIPGFDYSTASWTDGYSYSATFTGNSAAIRKASE